MPAPIGNKYAVGNNGGRPPIHDRERLAVDLWKWSLRKSSLNLYRWLGDNEINKDYLNEWAKEDEVFAGLYAMVKGNIAANREESVGSYGGLDRGVFLGTLRVYDKLAFDQWKEEKEIEYGLKDKSEKASNINVNIDSKPFKRDKSTSQISVSTVSDPDVESA